MMNYKKTLVWLVLVIGLVGGLASPAWADQNQNNQLNGLAGRLQALQQQILALQNRLQSLLAQLTSPTSTVPNWSDGKRNDGDQDDRNDWSKHPSRPERPARPMMPGSWRWPWPGQSSTTPATTAPTISQIRVVTQQTSAELFWQTDQLTTGQLTYDTVNPPGTNSHTSQASQLARPHQIHLSGLTPNTTYYYQISASNQTGLNTTSSVQSFTTKPEPTSDSTAPQLVFVSATNLTANNAKIIWVTNEAADSELWLATTTPVATTTPPTLQNSALEFYHELTATGLTANTTYYYVVKSRDASGNLGISSEASFLTTP